MGHGKGCERFSLPHTREHSLLQGQRGEEGWGEEGWKRERARGKDREKAARRKLGRGDERGVAGTGLCTYFALEEAGTRV